jgi:aldose 1-epimerase
MPFEVSIHGEPGEQLIILRDGASGTEAEIYTFGGLLNAFRTPVNGRMINVVDGFPSIADAKENILNGFKSAKLSPFVCRMRKGDYRINETVYHVEKHYLGDHAIHGLVYDHICAITGSEQNDDHAKVTLSLSYGGDDPGYPFPYHLQIEWMLQTGNKLTVTTTITHQNLKPILYADGWHPYFSLGGNADEWTLQFDAQVQFEYDEDLLPTGNKFSDKRFENGCSLKGIELDNSFELNGDGNAACVLSNNEVSLMIHPGKTYPILQVYIPAQRKSIAIENLSGAPDNFNNGIHLLTIPADKEYSFTTSYRIEVL